MDDVVKRALEFFEKKLVKGGGRYMKVLEEVYKKLPPEFQKEVEDFALFLLEKKLRIRKKKNF